MGGLGNYSFASSVNSQNDTLEQRFQLWQVLVNGIPDYAGIGSEVAVRHNISHGVTATQLAPSSGIGLRQRRCNDHDVVGRLTYISNSFNHGPKSLAVF